MVRVELHSLAKMFKVFHSCAADSHQGGATIMVHRKLLKNNDAFCRVFVPGRVMKLTIQPKNSSKSTIRGGLRSWNLHNWRLDPLICNEIVLEMKKDIEWAQTDPLHNLVLIQGDLNFDPPGESTFYLDGRVQGNSNSQEQPLDSGKSERRLDRIYSSLPCFAPSNMSISVRLLRDPFALQAE
eukprot:4138768-Karenia_brevis.AAC.1